MAEAKQQAIDDRGTSEQQGRAILRRLRDAGFNSDDAQLAQALGRPVEEVQAWLDGGAPVDDDLIIKARGLASERNINIE